MDEPKGNKPPPLHERKQAFAERQAAKGKGVFAGETPQGSGPPNRHGMPRLPVGQRLTRNWPVLDLGDQPEVPLAEWRLEVGGLVERPMTLSWSELLALPQTEEESDFHCVTTWSRMDCRFGGVRFVDLMAHVGVRPEARYVFTTGYDHAPGTNIPYTTNLSLDDALEPDVMLVHTWDGAPLPREHGGPLRMVTPQLYAWKGAKWLRKIELLAQDRLGFWEVRGYSRTAYPWSDDRYGR